MPKSETVLVHPCAKICGRIVVPGDKSISHRLGMLASLSAGISTIRGYLRSEDCLNTLRAVQALGAQVDWSGEAIKVQGNRWSKPSSPLDLGNSGTSMRLLAGLLAPRPWATELTGDESLRSRPMLRIKEPLELMGARVELLGQGRTAPVRITGGTLHGIEYAVPVASAQVKSCVMLAALFAEGTTRIVEPQPTRDHTERLFRVLGIPVEIKGKSISVHGFGANGPQMAAREWLVPGDFSSAAFWLVAASGRRGTQLEIENVGLNPSRTALLEVLARMRADVSVKVDERSLSPEPCGAIRVRGGELAGAEIGGAIIPNIIDELPIVAVAAALARGRTVIRDARELRVKESDRIAGMAVNLRKLGVPVEEHEDGMTVTGGAALRGGARLDSFGDHRVAMSMAILALYADRPVTIERVGCVDTSYPEFWDHMRSLGAHVEFDCGH